MPRRSVLCLALLVGVGGPRFARAGEGGERRAVPPAENVSYVPADDPTIRKAFQAVADAVAAGDARTAARTLQRIAESAPSAVVAVAEAAGQAGVFESATVVAHHRVLALGSAVAAAYEEEYGPRAATLLRSGRERRDLGAVADAFDRHAPTDAGRRAALLLVDLALERGDVDDALGWLDRLEDLEVAATAPDLVAALAPWRTARIDRTARALAATPAAEAALRRRLDALAPGAPLVGGAGPAEVRPADVRRAPLPVAWPTAGGGPSRTGVADAVPDRLVRVADEEIADPRAAPPGEDDERGRAKRPSPWIPTRGAVAGDRLVVSDGRRLHVLSLATHKLLSRAPIPLRPDDAAPPALRGSDARRVWGWIEGFGLTLDGDVVYANVPQEVADVGAESPGFAFLQALRPTSGRRSPWVHWKDAVSAVRLTGDGGTVLWVAGGGEPTPGLPAGMRLLGSPLVYRGAVHVAGIRPTKSTDDLFEAWHVALDPRTGAVRSAVFLGTGTPLRRKRADESMPAACVGAHGRVHVVTSLGIASAVDARTGRTLWSFRYDRGRPDGEDVTRRLSDDAESTDRRSSFTNHPPVVVDGRLYVAPTDGRYVLCLSDRPRGRERLLTRWPLHRTDDVRNLAIEQVVGVTDGRDGVPPTLVAVGQGYGIDPLHDPFTCVVGVDALSGRLRWERALPFGGLPEPFGLAVIAGDEVFVPTAKGIARYALADGADRPPIEAPTDDHDDEAYGNLVPVPGRGLVSLSPSRVTFWMRKK